MRLLFIDLKKKVPAHKSSYINIKQSSKGTFTPKSSNRKHKKEKRALGYKGQTTFANNYFRHKLMSDMCYGVFGGHIVKLNLSLANCRAFLQALILRTGSSLNVTLHKSVLLH